MFNSGLLHQYPPLNRSTPIYQLMYLEVLLTNHYMEANLETHMEEVHMENICLEDHHLLDHLDGQHLITHVYTTMVY